MFFNRLSNREKIGLYFIGLISVCAVLFYVIIEPVWKKWQDLNESINLNEQKLLKNLKILSQKDQIVELYNKYASDIKMKGSVEEETAVILSEIENIARSSNTYITDIKPQKVKDMEFYKEYFVELEAEGDIVSLTRFIYGLQSSKQILKVRQLRLNAKEDAGDKLQGYMVISKILIP